MVYFLFLAAGFAAGCLLTSALCSHAESQVVRILEVRIQALADQNAGLISIIKKAEEADEADEW